MMMIKWIGMLRLEEKLMKKKKKRERLKETRNHGRYRLAWRRHALRILEQRMMIWREVSYCWVASSSNKARKMIWGGLESSEIRPPTVFRRKASPGEAASPPFMKKVWWDQWRRERRLVWWIDYDKSGGRVKKEWEEETCGRVCSSHATSHLHFFFIIRMNLVIGGARPWTFTLNPNPNQIFFFFLK